MSAAASAGSITVRLNFDPDFNFFLQPNRQGKPLRLKAGHATTIKDLVESCGVPHTEIGALRLNGSASADVSAHISDGDCFEVFPVSSAGEEGSPLQPVPPETVRFVADIHLGKAARRLRLLGFDTLLFKGQDDRELLDIMEHDGRILLTRDRRLLMNNRVVSGCCIRSDRVEEQVMQVIERYGFTKTARPFTRCLACNALLESCRKASVESQLLPKTKRYYDTFLCCPSCGKIYWEGSHMKRLRAFVADILSRS